MPCTTVRTLGPEGALVAGFPIASARINTTASMYAVRLMSLLPPVMWRFASRCARKSRSRSTGRLRVTHVLEQRVARPTSGRSIAAGTAVGVESGRPEYDEARDARLRATPSHRFHAPGRSRCQAQTDRAPTL